LEKNNYTPIFAAALGANLLRSARPAIATIAITAYCFAFDILVFPLFDKSFCFCLPKTIIVQKVKKLKLSQVI